MFPHVRQSVKFSVVFISFHLFRVRIRRETWCNGPYAQVDLNLTLSQSQLKTCLLSLITKGKKGRNGSGVCSWLDTYVAAHTGSAISMDL
jgi:hypothetical protein